MAWLLNWIPGVMVASSWDLFKGEEEGWVVWMYGGVSSCMLEMGSSSIQELFGIGLRPLGLKEFVI